MRIPVGREGDAVLKACPGTPRPVDVVEIPESGRAPCGRARLSHPGWHLEGGPQPLMYGLMELR